MNESQYSEGPVNNIKKNGKQISKVRCLFRSKKYLGTPKEIRTHKDIEGKHDISNDVFSLEDLGKQNLSLYMQARERNDAIKLSIANVTVEEAKKNECVANHTLEEIKILIFQMISNLSKEKQELYEEMFVKTIKGRRKEKYVDFYYVLCEEHEREQINENLEDDNCDGTHQ